MPAVAVLKSILGSITLLGLVSTSSLTQTSVNDIHIVPRQLSTSMASAIASTKVIEDSGLHVLKTDVKLVLVPVSVTDSRQRLVTGLQAENFQVFEGKKPQEIRPFSSEDLPVSVGIILDASGSMHEKMGRVREAVHQFCEGANLQDEFFLISFADQPRVAADFTSSSQDIEKELLFTQPKGPTALLDA